jgi:serine phosphatase RsbU (regulator of sigma subunit)/ligand-binding sensor domain-containing protein
MSLKSKNMKLEYFLIFFLFTAYNILHSQEKYFFENISVSDGLSNSVVICTYQDHLGYLWIGTVDGLNRYDGYDIKVYKNKPDDSTSLPFNIISSINEDSEGNLLVGSIDYVSVYNRTTDSFRSISAEKGAMVNRTSISSILVDSKDRLWIATNYTGIQLYDDVTKEFKIIKISDYSGDEISSLILNFTYNITELANGNILTASPTSGIFIYNTVLNEFQPYFTNQNQNLKEVGDIFEDSAGKLWFGGKDQIVIYNPITYGFKSINMSDMFEREGDNYYGYFYEDKNKRILFYSNYGILETDFNGNTFSLITKDIPSINPNNFYRDNFGIYWIATAGNGLVKFDPTKKPFQFIRIFENGQTETKANPVIDIVRHPLKRDGLLLSLNTNGIYDYDRENSKFVKIINKDGTNLLSDDNGNLWYIFNNELSNLNFISERTWNIELPKIDYTVNYFVTKLKYGPDKKVWIADRQGVQLFNPETKSFNRIASITNKPVSPELISKIREIANNEKPLASILKVGEGASIEKEFSVDKASKVLIINLGEGRHTSLTGNMFDYGWLEDSKGKKIWAADNIVNSFNDGGGYKNRISFGCLDLPKGKYKIHYSSDIGHNYGSFNVPSPADSQWYGIQVLNLDDSEYSYLNEKIINELDNTHYPPFEVASDIEFSRKYINTVWISSSTGLIRLNLRDNTHRQYYFDDGTQRFPLVNQLSDILEDKDGMIWCSSNAGLIMFNPDSEEFQIITQSDGLASDIVSFMIEDLIGNLWFGAPGGISMLDKKNMGTELSFINYDNKDGINDLPFNKSIILTDDGEIYYGGYGGLNAFFPGTINSTLPKPIINSLNISGVPIEKMVTELNLSTDINKTEKIVLPFSDNNISLEFASIHFSRPTKNKLAYILEGMDEDWNYTNRRYASYLNLPPGEYVFRLKGSNGDGVWNSKETSISIKVNPPWYRTIFAYIGYGLLFIGLIFGIDRLQRRRLLNKERNTAAIKEANLRAQLAEAENERKSKELDEARQLQLSMLPKELPQIPHLNIAVYMQTATEVGGDYYDFNIGLDGTLTVVLGDATGHGMKAGTMVTTTKSLFNVLAPNPNIVETFHEMTRCLKLMHMEKLSMCMTMLKIMGNKVQMSAAGMPPVFIYKQQSQSIEEHVMKGMPLGTFNNFPYSLIESELSVGDTILLMSDGFPELFNENKEMYGYKRARNYFEEIAGESPEEIISKLKNAGSDWVKDADPDDDVTFVVIKVK